MTEVVQRCFRGAQLLMRRKETVAYTAYVYYLADLCVVGRRCIIDNQSINLANETKIPALQDVCRSSDFYSAVLITLLNPTLLIRFCSPRCISSLQVECLKYDCNAHWYYHCLRLFDFMTADSNQQAASDAAAAARPEASSLANMSMEGKGAGSGSARVSDNEGSDSVSNGSSDETKKFRKLREDGFTGKCWGIISFTPSRCRWDPEHPPQFSLGLNILFSFVCPIISSILLL